MAHDSLWITMKKRKVMELQKKTREVPANDDIIVEGFGEKW